MKSYRVAILGCRSRGGAAARAYHQHPRAAVVALCDLVPERCDALGEELGVSARYTDLDRMIAATGPDIVVIPTGTEFHYDLAMRALAHRVHLDVEKPICVDLEQADAVLARAREQGVRVAVHHQGRVGASMRAVRQAVGSGRIGALRYLQGSCKGYYAGLGLMNIGTHILNNMLGLAGPCRSVAATAVVAGRRIGPEDAVTSPLGMGTIAGERITASLEFGGDVTASLLQHRFPKVDSTAYMLEIYGTEGRLFWRSSEAWWLPTPHFVPGAAAAWQPLPLEPLDTFDPQGRADEADYAYADEFVRALDTGGEHPCSGREGHHVLEIIMAVFESAAYGRRVELPQADRRHPLRRWRQEAGLPGPGPVPRDYGPWLEQEDRRLGRG